MSGMEGGRLRVTFESWGKAGGDFDEVASAGPNEIGEIVTRTTDGSACEAASGPSTVDAAVAVMLGGFSELMHEGYLKPLQEGLASEAEALHQTGVDLREMEQRNADRSGEIEEVL